MVQSRQNPNLFRGGNQYGGALLTFLVTSGFGVIYVLFHLTFTIQFLDWDQVVYSNNMLNSLIPGRLPLFNPHHLHLEISGKVFHEWMVKQFGDAGFTDLVFNNRLKSLLFAAAGMVFAILAGKEITGKLRTGVLAGIMIAATHGYMAYTTQVDTPIYPASLFLVNIWIFRKLETVRWNSLLLFIIGGIILFLSIMTHQYMAITSALTCIILALPPKLIPEPGTFHSFRKIRKTKQSAIPVLDKNRNCRYAGVILMAMIGISLTAGAYYQAGRGIYNLSFDNPTPEESRGVFRSATFQQWLFFYETTGMWGHGVSENNVAAPFRGLTDGFLSPDTGTTRDNRNFDFRYNVQNFKAPESFVHNQLLIFLLITAGSVIFMFPRLITRYRKTFLFVLVSGVVFTLFTSYWEAHYFEFWLIPSICIIFLFIITVDSAGTVVPGSWSKLAGAGLLIYGFFIGGLFFSHNTLQFLAPYSRTKIREGISPDWKPAYYMNLYSDSVYRHPENVHQDAFNIPQGEYLAVPESKEKPE